MTARLAFDRFFDRDSCRRVPSIGACGFGWTGRPHSARETRCSSKASLAFGYGTTVVHILCSCAVKCSLGKCSGVR